MKKWIELKETGLLYREIVLVRFDIPLLFVCLDKENSRYLVLCVDEEQGEYLITRCSAQIILQMLNNTIPMDEAFKRGEQSWLTQYDFINKAFTCKALSEIDMKAELLPDKGAYFELNNSKILDYIKMLREEKSGKAEIFQINIDSYVNTLRTVQVDFDNEFKQDKGIYLWNGDIPYNSIDIYYYKLVDMTRNVQNTFETTPELTPCRNYFVERSRDYAISM